MSENASPNTPDLNPTPAATSQTSASADPKTAAAAGSTPGYTSSSTVSSMADLETKAPEVAEAMKMGIAMQITQQMERHGKRMKELMQKQRYGG